jgi:hypothetical protein
MKLGYRIVRFKNATSRMGDDVLELEEHLRAVVERVSPGVPFAPLEGNERLGDDESKE